jgi:spermidine synthase
LIAELPKRSNRYLYITVFVTGMVTLAVELSAQRLIGNVFGTSNLVWANVIGLILLYLSIGYFIGGRWADRSPNYTTFYRLIVWSAFFNALVPLIARPVVTTAANAVFNIESEVVVGSFLTILVLFAVPITILGCVSPFAIRLAVDDAQRAGAVSGRIYAISTIGSLLGTFAPNLVLIPVFGTTATFLIFAGVLYIVALIGLWREQGTKALIWLWMPLVIAVLALLVLNGRPLRDAGANATLLYEDESAYNYIQVQELSDGTRYLFLNEGQGIHSQWHPTEYYYGRTWDFFLTAPYFNAAPHTMQDVESLLVIGLATGTIPRQYIHVYGNIPIDGIEIDPQIIEVGEQYFEMNAEHMPSLTAYAQDGRYMLNRLQRDYSVIGIDAYRPPYIPWHLTTVEFFEEVRDHLTDDGVVVINVGRTPTDRRLVDAITATMLQVYPTVHVMDVPYAFNSILVATLQPTQAENLAANLAALPDDAHPMLREILTLAASTIVPTQPSDLVFTDDHASVEALVDSLVLSFLLSDDLEQLGGQ